VRERHRIVAGMLLALTMAGDRVERAELVGAATRDELRSALGMPQFEEPLGAALIVSYACRTCGLWVAGQPRDGCCHVCGEQLGDVALPT
jgi:rubrerythrin